MSSAAISPAIDEEKMNAFLGKVVTDFGAAFGSMLGYIGTKLGLYEALADSDLSRSLGLAAAIFYTKCRSV